ncbi:MAG: hypothetical protein ACMUJM_18185 [bacterium]
MNNFCEESFPHYFGKDPDDFIEKYKRLIFLIIQDYKYVLAQKKIEQQELFQNFFLHIGSNNYEKLKKYDAQRNTKPSVYLGKILRNFIKDQIKLNHTQELLNIEEIEEIKDYANVSIFFEEECIITDVIRDALHDSYACITNREKLIFDKTYNDGIGAHDLAYLLGIKVNLIYETNRKVKQILRENLEKRGITIKKRRKNTFQK